MAKSQGGDPKSFAGRPTKSSVLLGQVFTPHEIALEMAQTLVAGRRATSCMILDPAVGPGTFQKALLHTGQLNRSDKMDLFDVDPEMIRRAKKNTADITSKRYFHAEDYLLTPSQSAYDLAIFNPPYVRQEWLDKKEEYRRLFKLRYRLCVPGTSNLYVYFVAKVLRELAPGGKMVCIIYDSWQSTKYGRWLAALLNRNCEQVETQSLLSQPFKDRLIDATILSAIRSAGEFRPSNDLASPENIEVGTGLFSDISSFTHIDNLFETKRGLRLKQANFFLCNSADADRLDATPFVKKPGQIKGFAVLRDHPESALLVTKDCAKKKTMAELSRRLGFAEQCPDENRSILNWYRERPDTWFIHRTPPFAPLLFNYYLRNRPKHILNPSHPYSDNFYGLLPKTKCVATAILALMNSTCVATSILANSRNQGGGLAKIQLYEYRNVWIPNWTIFSGSILRQLAALGNRLIEAEHDAEATIGEIDKLIFSELSDARLEPSELRQLFSKWDLLARKPKACSAVG